MTAINTQTLPVAEAAFLLRVHLGPLRSWTNFLTDNIRGQQSIAGFKLMPCGRQHDGKAYRPIYATRDVTDFIAKVLAAVPTAGKTPIKPTTLAIDKGRHWWVNKFDKDGAPVAMLRTIRPGRQAWTNPTGGGGTFALNT